MKIRLSALREIIRECTHESMEEELPGGRDLNYEMPEEGKHAKGHLFHTSLDAQRLYDLLDDNDNIPSWCMEYIALSRHSLGVVHDYLAYKIQRKK